MELQAVVKHRGALAYYAVSPESQGIYQARLVRYYGNPDDAPPEKVLLVKSVRRWIGSSDRQDLLNDLGHIIDSRTQEHRRSARKTGEPTGSEE